jgi:hypothetical protein
VRFPFALERYLLDLRHQTAWAPDFPIEDLEGAHIPRPALYRIAHLWALALLDDRVDALLLPVLVTAEPLLDRLDSGNRARAWDLAPGFFRERLEAGACLLFVDGPTDAAALWPRNRAFIAV